MTLRRLCGLRTLSAINTVGNTPHTAVKDIWLLKLDQLGFGEDNANL